MFKFNSNHIMTGQIKQILNAFNLPSYKIYTAQHYKYFLDHGVESPELADGLYIKWDRLWEYKNGKWEKNLSNYAYNNKYLNFTRNFPIQNNIYDSDTHEYLGEFLRFQRDYLGVDLMPLYNCFSNRVCNNLNISINQPEYGLRDKRDENGNIIYRELPTLDEEEEHAHIREVPKIPVKESYVKGTKKLKKQFYSRDKDFVIYMVPIKFFKEYTIALDCATSVEICCGLYGDYLEELPELVLLNNDQLKVPPVNTTQFISDLTYRRYNGLTFNTPIVWSGIPYSDFYTIVKQCASAGYEFIQGAFSDDEYKKPKKEVLESVYRERLFNKECDLKLFIKIPVQSRSSIVVLEGDYHDYNNAKYSPEVVYVTQPVTYQENINGKRVSTTRNIITTQHTQWVKKHNKTITNYETTLYAEVLDPRTRQLTIVKTELPEVEDRPFKPISPLQLLMFNTQESYPFSDRLLEYLTGNVITEWDENADNIRRAQKVMELNNNKLAINGAWEGKMRNILYDYMMGGNPSNVSFGIDVIHDILGYVDKDVEKVYTAWKFENCLDAEGKPIQLTVKLPQVDKEGNQILDENNKPIYVDTPVYKKVKQLLEGKTVDPTDEATLSTHSLLTEDSEFLLTVLDEGEIAVYKQKYIPQGNIQNIDIYGEED